MEKAVAFEYVTEPKAKRFELLDAALDAVSYEWLSTEHPALMDAITEELARGLTPLQIRLRVQARTDRTELALRCEQAARHLARGAA